MTVIVKYIVVRNGEEKMTFATKKEADAYDKMLDIADNLFEFLEDSDLKLSESQMENISLRLAEERDSLIPILRGVKPKPKPATDAAPKATPKATPKAAAKTPPKKATRASKKPAEMAAKGSPAPRKRQVKK